MEQTTLRDWQAYNLAQTQEGRLTLKLLRELMDQIEFKPKKRRGRPFLYVPDVLFCCGVKLYGDMAARRIISQLEMCKDLHLIKKVPHHNTLNNYFHRKELTPILKELLTLSSLPLKELEEHFSADSTGFSTSRYAEWSDYKYSRGKDSKSHVYVKAHAMTGARTNVVTALEVTNSRSSDHNQFAHLLAQTAKVHDMKEVSADKAYSSRVNLDVTHGYGAYPFIPFRKNATRRAGGSYLWTKCFLYFKNHREEFLKKYHLRSNVESSFSAIKRKFGSKLYCRMLPAQTNELYLKYIVYNITVLIRFLFELGVDIDFNKKSGDDFDLQIAI